MGVLGGAFFLNRRLKSHCLNNSCFILAGDRGAGKSSLLGLFAEIYSKAGYKVYCQYPYKGAFQIPMKLTNVNGVQRYNVDKQWLYTSDLSDCCVLIDEGKNVWPARSWSKWTQSDDDFFDFIRHTNTVIVIATLSYDNLDLNVRRSADELIYITKGFWHFTHCEASRTTVCKVADRQTEVVGRLFKKGMRKVSWDVCEIPIGNYLFWRKPYYDKFLTLFVHDDKPEPSLELWPEDLFL